MLAAIRTRTTLLSARSAAPISSVRFYADRKPTPAEEAAANAINNELNAENSPRADANLSPEQIAAGVKKAAEKATKEATEKAAAAAAAVSDALFGEGKDTKPKK